MFLPFDISAWISWARSLILALYILMQTCWRSRRKTAGVIHGDKIDDSSVWVSLRKNCPGGRISLIARSRMVFCEMRWKAFFNMLSCGFCHQVGHIFGLIKTAVINHTWGNRLCLTAQRKIHVFCRSSMVWRIWNF